MLVTSPTQEAAMPCHWTKSSGTAWGAIAIGAAAGYATARRCGANIPVAVITAAGAAAATAVGLGVIFVVDDVVS